MDDADACLALSTSFSLPKNLRSSPAIMKVFAAPLLAVVALSTGALAQDQFMINTPTNVVVCQPIRFTWVGGTAPYFLSILPGSQPSAPAIQDLGRQDGTSFTWTANITPGTSIGLTLRDSTGTVAQSAPFTVNDGPDHSCIGGSSGSSSSTGGSSSTGTAGATSSSSSVTAPTASTTSAANTVTSRSLSATSRPVSTGSGTSSAAQSSSTSNAAVPTQAVHIGAAGMVGAAVIALLA